MSASKCRPGRCRRHLSLLPELLHHIARRFVDLLAIALPCLGDLRQNRSESRVPPAVFRRKIGTAEKRLELRRQPHRHRPAPAARRCLYERHVNTVHVGALLAIHLDRHVMFVHQRGDRLVFKTLPLHHVAPVTGRVADREENGFVFQSGFLKRLLAPRIPIHRIVRVLQQIRTLLFCQTIGMHVRLHRTSPATAGSGARTAVSGYLRSLPP